MGKKIWRRAPVRAGNGYRLYSQEEIGKLRLLKKRVDKTGMPISQAVRELNGGKTHDGGDGAR